jgi:hypothetical protein
MCDAACKRIIENYSEMRVSKVSSNVKKRRL